jgi:hypothetical protein
VRRTALLVPAVVLAVTTALSGCGWVKAGGVSHIKPDGFVLRGYVSVARATNGPAGTPCQTPSAGIAANDPVTVADPSGRVLATGVLGSGVLAMASGAYRCNFPFQIPGVGGGHDSYAISPAGRPAVSFAATDLRQDKPAVISVG